MFRRAEADAYGAEEPWLFPDLDGKEPISLGIWLTVCNGLFDELGSAFHRLWSPWCVAGFCPLCSHQRYVTVALIC